MQASHSLSDWLHRLEQLQPDHIELGLTRIQEVSVRAGLADPAFKIVTVAGTNGKGSTVAYTAAILKTMGLRVGVYTSPHFVDFNERIVIDGGVVSDADLCAAFSHIDANRGNISLTYFEFTTLAAIYCFSKSAIDVAVLEVGLGGRLDAVNAWHSTIACITSIGIDHTDWLGDDLESIGYEKAGVARRGCALVCGEKNPPVSIARHAKAIGANLLMVNQDYSAQVTGALWTFNGPRGSAELPLPAIDAGWAVDNAALAVCVCAELLAAMPPSSALASALTDVSIDGRMQHAEYKSVPVLLDVAHNHAAAALLANYLQQHPVEGATVAVFSCMQDKDALAIVNVLEPVIDQWFVAQIDYPRAFKTGQLNNILTRNTAARTEVFASVIPAFEAAVAQSTVDSRVIVFGSFHLVGPILELLNTEK